MLIHAGVGVGSFGATLTESPTPRGCPIVLAHAGVSDLAWLWRVLPEHPNVYFDTSWWNPPTCWPCSPWSPRQILGGSDTPYMDVELGLAIDARGARSPACPPMRSASSSVASSRRCSPASRRDRRRPGAGPRGRALPHRGRLASLLSAAGGCMLGGGDPSGHDRPGGGRRPRSAKGQTAASSTPGSPSWSRLVGAGTEESIPALALALSLATAPGVGERRPRLPEAARSSA